MLPSSLLIKYTHERFIVGASLTTTPLFKTLHLPAKQSKMVQQLQAILQLSTRASARNRRVFKELIGSPVSSKHVVFHLSAHSLNKQRPWGNRLIVLDDEHENSGSKSTLFCTRLSVIYYQNVKLQMELMCCYSMWVSGGGGGAGAGAPVTKLTKRIEELKTKLITKTDELNDALKSKSEV